MNYKLKVCCTLVGGDQILMHIDLDLSLNYLPESACTDRESRFKAASQRYINYLFIYLSCRRNEFWMRSQRAAASRRRRRRARTDQSFDSTPSIIHFYIPAIYWTWTPIQKIKFCSRRRGKSFRYIYIKIVNRDQTNKARLKNL